MKLHENFYQEMFDCTMVTERVLLYSCFSAKGMFKFEAFYNLWSTIVGFAEYVNFNKTRNLKANHLSGCLNLLYNNHFKKKGGWKNKLFWAKFSKIRILRPWSAQKNCSFSMFLDKIHLKLGIFLLNEPFSSFVLSFDTFF